MQKKVSLAMATYNGEKYIAELLESLQNQTQKPWEIIISDDCSTDKTIEIIQRFKSSLNIKIIQNETNLGINKNFEKAVQNCSGDYILICDQDDVWFPNNIEEKTRLLENLSNEKPALITTASIITDQNLSPIRNLKLKSDIDNWQEQFTKCFQGTTMAFNRVLANKLNSWPESFKEFPYDYYIYLTALFTGKIYASSKALMYYRTHSNNASFKKSNIKACLKKIIPFHRLYQDKISKVNINRMNRVVQSLNSKDLNQPQLGCFSELKSCIKKEHISLINFFFIKQLPLKIRLRATIGLFISTLQKKQ